MQALKNCRTKSGILACGSLDSLPLLAIIEEAVEELKELVVEVSFGFNDNERNDIKWVQQSLE